MLLNRQGLTEDFFESGEIDAPWAALTSVIIALESAEGDGGAFSNDIHCTSRRDSTCRSERDSHPGGELADEIALRFPQRAFHQAEPRVYV